jgi:hypothetical protein
MTPGFGIVPGRRRLGATRLPEESSNNAAAGDEEYAETQECDGQTGQDPIVLWIECQGKSAMSRQLNKLWA